MISGDFMYLKFRSPFGPVIIRAQVVSLVIDQTVWRDLPFTNKWRAEQSQRPIPRFERVIGDTFQKRSFNGGIVEILTCCRGIVFKATLSFLDLPGDTVF